AEAPLARAETRRVEPADLPSGDEPLELSFQVGPTYVLDYTEPPPPSAELELSLRPGLEPDLGFGFRGRLREGAPPWTRFDPDAAHPAELGSGPWTLTARDPNG